MQFTSAHLLLAVSLVPLVVADTHYAGLCVNYEGGQSVYNDAATKAACGNYFMRNKGSEWWNTCPDCGMENRGGIDYCYSKAGHIGGDELNYYCKYNGAHGSAAD
ncbi:hypothetical protein K505DRAFT_303638 [Melanomma pulvis-pyrius CBS 109.77]|uniref:Uncharacterized protein n=1 Tax=Melanomma pulvis-pyrius CBS 109.77 TaxID=1314802 RepID=A0A6A6XDY0_9PLEO|nr:hypothetical protein K505DRAFT_303638 [Melanomma pulvis-pyrius CBS 109.77]